jgi:DNA-binding MarR family transcriptional regulator
MIPMPSYVFTVQSDYDKLMRKVDGVVRAGGHDITPVAALMVSFIGTKALSMKEIRGYQYYIGSNMSYNANRLERLGYIVKTIVRNDKRRKVVSLTPKGKILAEQIRKALGGEEGRVAA